MAKDFSNLKLNNDQIDAVKFGNGPLLIIAGAGTGKTAVITERIKYLITSGLAKPEEILALTFTEKSALEVETRVDEVMPLSYGDVWIMTFHSFADRILRESGLHIGLPSNFKLMTKEKSIDLFRRNLFDFSLSYFRPLGNPNKFVDSILTHFSRLQDEVITPKEYLEWARKFKGEELDVQKWQELATVYKEYNDLKLKEAKFDFGDLMIKTIELFKLRPNILGQYQEKFKYILVDEYQDTNFAQNELVNLIADKYKNVTVVGDDNQSIYRFRGAAISNILTFIKTYPNAKTITLNKNYRSTQAILDGAYRLIKHNDPDTLEVKMGISKKLISNTSENFEIECINKNTGEDEVESVVEEIKSLTDGVKPKFNYKDIAILVRANNHANAFIREFERQGIPHQFLGPSKLFEKEEIVDLISYLKSLHDPEDSENFHRLLSSNFLNIDTLELIKMNSQSRKNSTSVYDIFIETKVHPKLLEILSQHQKEINTKSSGQILYEYLQEMGIYKEIIENEDDVKAKNISLFFNKIKSFENENPNIKLAQVIDYIDLLSELGESPTVTNSEWQIQDAVNILTVHSSKGLEFPVVFMVNLVSDRFPSRNRNDDLPIPDDLIKEQLPQGDFHIQEERRLFYVGMTRAKVRLYLTGAKIYNDGKREKKISPFVFEAIEKVEAPENKKSIFKPIFKPHSENELKSNSTIHEPIQIDFLSVSQIETFEMCPMHYKLKYIYSLPTSFSASASFGVSIHEVLKKILTTKDLDVQSVMNEYKNSFREDGYENKKHKQMFFEKGKEYLLGFLKNGYDPKVNTVDLEKKFVIKLNQSLKVGGTIDRIDDLGNGEYEIIDYKTGASVPTQKEVDKDLQLSVYAIATSQMYKISPDKIKLSLYYLDTQEKFTTMRTEEELEKVKEEILKVKEEILKSNFKCNNNYFCQKGCEYSMFCNAD